MYQPERHRREAGLTSTKKCTDTDLLEVLVASGPFGLSQEGIQNIAAYLRQSEALLVLLSDVYLEPEWSHESEGAVATLVEKRVASAAGHIG